MLTVSKIEELLSRGVIDATEAAQMRAVRLAHLEAMAADPTSTKSTSAKSTPEPEADAPPKERKKKKVAKSASSSTSSSSAKSTPQPTEEAAFQVLKISIPGADQVEYCPKDMHYFGPTRGRAGFHTFRFGSNFYHRTVEQWAVLSREYYNERIGAWIRKCIAMHS